MNKSFADSLVVHYPERSPWKRGAYNIKPTARLRDTISDSFREAARREMFVEGHYNPLRTMYGGCPLDVHQPSVQVKDLPFPDGAFTELSPLQQLPAQASIKFEERVYCFSNWYMFKVRIGDKLRLLKIYASREEPDHHHEAKRFNLEKNVYAQLKARGLHKKGFVPRCYGWFQLSDEQIAAAEDVFKYQSRERPLLGRPEKPMALVLEYINESCRLTTANITEDIADKALRALHAVHSAYVIHRTFHAQDCFVIPRKDGKGERVVITNFDHALTARAGRRSTRQVRRQDLLMELAKGWKIFYEVLLPNQFIGLQK